jgi:PPOX class probable F420-dependent enzyme
VQGSWLGAGAEAVDAGPFVSQDPGAGLPPAGGAEQPGVNRAGAEPATVTADEAAFLERQRSGRLATVDPRGQPHAVPICYALLDGIVYTPIDEKSKTADPRSLRRIRNILANPKVCLVVDHYEDADWSRLAWLQVRGEASLVEDSAERARALAALRARYRQYRTMALESLPLIRITPTRLVGWNGGAGSHADSP